LGVLANTIGGVMYMHSFAKGGTLLSLGLGMIIYIVFVVVKKHAIVLPFGAILIDVTILNS
jgi:hypothetical protein